MPLYVYTHCHTKGDTLYSKKLHDDLANRGSGGHTQMVWMHYRPLNDFHTTMLIRDGRDGIDVIYIGKTLPYQHLLYHGVLVWLMLVWKRGTRVHPTIQSRTDKQT